MCVCVSRVLGIEFNEAKTKLEENAQNLIRDICSLIEEQTLSRINISKTSLKYIVENWSKTQY